MVRTTASLQSEDRSGKYALPDLEFGSLGDQPRMQAAASSKSFDPNIDLGDFWIILALPKIVLGYIKNLEIPSFCGYHLFMRSSCWSDSRNYHPK
jgi:hypothetical protein